VPRGTSLIDVSPAFVPRSRDERDFPGLARALHEGATMKRVSVLLFFLGLAAACKHETTTNGAFVEPEHVSDEAGACTGACCTRPVAGAPCEVEAGALNENCTWPNYCPTGLLTSEVTLCMTGSWVVLSGACPADGTNDDRGCPASQPAKDDPCEQLDGGGVCNYSLPCEGGIEAVAQATCVSGKWQTTAPIKC
jgi:hypothetical protein